MLAKLLGGEVVDAVGAVGKIVDDLFTSDEERLDKELAKERLVRRSAMIQAEINKIEAAHRSVWVAGWRPFIGWVCGSSLAYSFILRDLIAWGMVNSGTEVSLPPELAMDQLIWVLGGLLGLGGMRTVEKLQGRSK